MVVISFVSYPPESAKELGKRFLELSPLPDYITMEGPYAYASTGNGMLATTLYKFDKSKAAEALESINSQLVAFYGVPGYTYAVRVCAGAQTALKMMGLR